MKTLIFKLRRVRTYDVTFDKFEELTEYTSYYARLNDYTCDGNTEQNGEEI